MFASPAYWLKSSVQHSAEYASEWEEWINRAFLSLIAKYDAPFSTEGGLEVGWATSGFVLEVEGNWFWITAQHSLDDLEERVEQASGIKTRMHPNQYFSHSAEDEFGNGVPFSYRHENRLDIARASAAVLDEPELSEHERKAHEFFRSLDINAFALGEMYVSSLKALGVKPFTPSDVWRVEDHTIYESSVAAATFGVAGMPVNAMVRNAEGIVEVAHFKVLPITLDSDEGPENEFIPKWTATDHRGSVKGMSGGPVFLLFEGKPYWCGVLSKQRISGSGEPSRLIVSPSRLIAESVTLISREMNANR